ncbi:MAG: hypothetical protein JSR78_19205 [Proteobacteria bacterium]|nr:hypothetical protein [Pseudomonadota bacterium]
MQRYRKVRRGCLLLTIAGLACPATGRVALADSVPESIRIQEKAEKAYEAAPVVPIERGNAHHRDVKDGGEGGDGGVGGYEALPPPEPPAAKQNDTNK